MSYNILSGKGERTPSEIDSLGFSIDIDGEERIAHLDPRVGEGRLGKIRALNYHWPFSFVGDTGRLSVMDYRGSHRVLCGNA